MTEYITCIRDAEGGKSERQRRVAKQVCIQRSHGEEANPCLKFYPRCIGCTDWMDDQDKLDYPDIESKAQIARKEREQQADELQELCGVLHSDPDCVMDALTDAHTHVLHIVAARFNVKVVTEPREIVLCNTVEAIVTCGGVPPKKKRRGKNNA